MEERSAIDSAASKSINEFAVLLGKPRSAGMSKLCRRTIGLRPLGSITTIWPPGRMPYQLFKYASPIRHMVEDITTKDSLHARRGNRQRDGVAANEGAPVDPQACPRNLASGQVEPDRLAGTRS